MIAVKGDTRDAHGSNGSGEGSDADCAAGGGHRGVRAANRSTGADALSHPGCSESSGCATDPEPQLPFTNRFIADLAAMPKAQVVFLDGVRNSTLFNEWSGGKVLVSPWLHGPDSCMNLTYSIFRSGQQQAVFGLVVAPMPAGVEPASACVDRAAGQFYQALVIQGL